MDPDNDPIVERIRSAAQTAPRPPHHVDLLARAERTSTHRRRSITVAAVAGFTAVVGAAVLVAAIGNGPDLSADVDAADQSGTPAPTVGCAGMTVASTSTTADDLVVTLRNGGTSRCDVRGLEVATLLGSYSLRDRATAADLPPGDPLADGLLAPGGAVLVIAATDTCQSAGAPVEVVLSDGTTLNLTFPGGPMECVQPGFGIQIKSVGTTATGDNLVVGVNPAVKFRPLDQARGSARWDPERATLTYVSPTAFNGCLVEGRATRSGLTVQLTLSPAVPETPEGADPDAVGCIVVATVYGLTEAPTELTVAEDGETNTVPVEQAVAAKGCRVNDPCSGPRPASNSEPAR